MRDKSIEARDLTRSVWATFVRGVLYIVVGVFLAITIFLIIFTILSILAYSRGPM